MSDPQRRVWPDVLAHIRQHAPTIARHWFNDLEPTGLSGGVVTIQADTPTQRDYLEHHAADAFDDALRVVTGRLVTARFVTAADLVQTVEPQNESSARTDHRPPTEHAARESLKRHDHGTLPLSPDYTFEHFIVGPGNRLAHAAAKAVAGNPGKAYNPLFIHGDVGLGKTHLLQAICLDLIEQRPGIKIFYTSCEHFMTRFIADVKAGQMEQFRHQFRAVDALVIDDIQFLAKRDRTQEEFFHTFNALYQADKQIIMTSDAPPEEIPDLEDRLVSRFKWGLVTEVAPPTFETRLEIIKEKGRLRGIEIPDDVAQLVAQRGQANIRELEGDLTKLQLHASMHGVDTLSLQIAVEALGDPMPAREIPVTVDQIIAQITEYFGVRTTDLQSKKRSRSIALPRQVGMYLARKHTRHSLEEIGGYFGGRDHTTVLHAIRSIEGKTNSDENLSASVTALESRLRVAGRDR